MSTPRIIPPDEARNWAEVGESGVHRLLAVALDLAHTAALRGEQREAALEQINEWRRNLRHIDNPATLLLANGIIDSIARALGAD